MRIYFVEPKVIASYFGFTPKTICEWCKAGKYGKCKEGTRWKIPITTLRKVHPEVPEETWIEIINDFYAQEKDKRDAKKALSENRIKNK